MKKCAFTLVEIITVVAILGILSVASFSVYTTWQNKNKVSLARTIVVQALSEAKQRAVSGANDKNWGLKYEIGKVIVFSGSDYLERDVVQDKIFDLPGGVTINSFDEIIFNKLTGMPVEKKDLTIFYAGQITTISVSAFGVFSN